MSNIYFNLTPSRSVIMQEIADALILKYETNVTIHFINTSHVVFSCSAISNKVIRITWSGSINGMGVLYGDAWTSNENITNAVSFFGDTSGGTSNYLPLAAHLILGDDFLLLNLVNTRDSRSNGVCVVGKLTNGKYVAIGCTNSTNLGRNTSDAVAAYFVTLSYGFANNSNKLYKQNIIIAREDGLAELNSNGTLATINGIYNISYLTTANTVYSDSSKFISCCEVKTNEKITLKTPLLVEFI